MKIVLIFSLSLTLIGCNNSNKNIEENTLVKQDTLSLNKEDLKTIKYVDFAIDSRAKSTLINWDKYDELNQITKEFKSANFTFLKDNHDNVIAFVNDLRSTLPPKIDTAPIQARLLIIETKLFKLESTVNQTASKVEMKTALKDYLQAFSNFKFQINKLFEKESQNIQKPL